MSPSLEFDLFRFDPVSGDLIRCGRPVPLRHQAALLLADLILRRSRWVPRCELASRIWCGAQVSESSLSTLLCELRLAIGDDGRRQAVIRTRRGYGYRFVAAVKHAREPGAHTECAAVREGTMHDTAAHRRHDTCIASPVLDVEPGATEAIRSLEAAGSSGPRQLHVWGPDAGAVADTCVSIAADRGWCIVRGRRTGAGCPQLWPWWQVAAAFSDPGHDATEAESRAWRRLSIEISSHARVAHVSPGSLGALAERQRQFALCDGIARNLWRAARRRPLLVCLEGMGPADEATARLVEFSLHSAERVPLWIVTTAPEPPAAASTVSPKIDTLVARQARRPADQRETRAEPAGIR